MKLLKYPVRNHHIVNVVRKCFLNGVQVGFVLMIENNIPFTAEHLAAMSDVSRAISSVVGHYHPELFQYTSADQQLLELC